VQILGIVSDDIDDVKMPTYFYLGSFLYWD